MSKPSGVCMDVKVALSMSASFATWEVLCSAAGAWNLLPAEPWQSAQPTLDFILLQCLVNFCAVFLAFIVSTLVDVAAILVAFFLLLASQAAKLRATRLPLSLSRTCSKHLRSRRPSTRGASPEMLMRGHKHPRDTGMCWLQAAAKKLGLRSKDPGYSGALGSRVNFWDFMHWEFSLLLRPSVGSQVP
eukprot:1145236-Pelagomonas_calceolata.AAC.3